jgi:hypothetical protein
MSKKRRRGIDKDREAEFYNQYLKHLPVVPFGALKKPGLYFAVHHHDDWCRIYMDGTCDCNVEIEMREVPEIS